MNILKIYIKVPTDEYPLKSMKQRFTVLRHPLISGLLIGAIGGTIGTLIYNAIKNTKFWSRFDSAFDFGLRLLNRSYQTPLYIVVLLLIGFLISLVFVRRTSKP
ncbi:hypothetical protein [Dyadobacter bucti]|jgi:F0F1-type ATP synthase assembly protein I|uniref:hypothetical protein n=1 Tax=Dyadobacter bucti TaxID=2572203 RepID=UPI003F72B03C